MFCAARDLHSLDCKGTPEQQLAELIHLYID